MKKHLSLCLVLCACGGGGSKSNPVVNQHNSYSVATVADLPTCTSSREGQLFYIQADQEFQTCVSGSWQVITIGNSVDSGFTCAKIVSSRYYVYHVIKYTNGDVWTECEISDTTKQYSSSNYYVAAQTGAANATCLVTYDLDSASSGYWNFNTGVSTVTVTYSDPPSASNGTTITYLVGDCVAF